MYTQTTSRIGFCLRRQPLSLNPPASLNFLKLSCFGVSIACYIFLVFLLFFSSFNIVYALENCLQKSPSLNQTPTISPFYPQDLLPFSISIEKVPFHLLNGIHSGASAIYHGKWVFIAGRTNGLHGFDSGNNNFPPCQQNKVVYVVDLKKEQVYSRSLYDFSSGLTEEQINQLSVTSPQFFQTEKTLYISGGYGTNTSGLFGTQPVLSALNIRRLIKWVKHGNLNDSIERHMKQTTDPLLQVTGGYMTAVNSNLDCLLVFGQNFEGFYNDSSNGAYTKQVRRFKIIDKQHHLGIKPQKSEDPNPNYRRRDLNVVPVILDEKPAYVALSGVFTLEGGIWTVPVLIHPDGSSTMSDPSKHSTFKQGMNNYVCPTIGLYSKSKKNMYIIALGGISYGYFQNGSLQVDSEIPFINQVTTIQIDKHGRFTQYIMDEEYPVILSTGSNPGNPLLFGAGAYFFPSEDLSSYKNGVFKYDEIGKKKKSRLLGYIVGGIMSTLPNTNTRSDSTASPYIFRVMLNP